MAHRTKSSQSGSGTPVTVTPLFTGQVYYDTLNNKSYIAKSKTTGDWLLLGLGDMTKAVYDIDINNIVDKAESLDDGTNIVTALEIRNHLDNLPVYGTEFQFSEDLPVSITTSKIFQNKLNYNTTNLPVGMYKVQWSYGYNHDSAKNDFHARLVLDNDILVDNLVMEHRQEPKDSGGAPVSRYMATGTDQLYRISGFRYLNLTAGIHNFKLDYRTTKGGDESSIWDLIVSLFRVT